jgi:putative restriction endonuclease
MTLPALLRKAAGDAGFDLLLGSDGEWQRMGVSGTPHVVWIVPSGAGALLAVKERAVLQEFGQATWTEVPLPLPASGAMRCRSADELLRALHRTRMLLAQLPPAPEHEFAQRLEEVDSTEAEAMVRRRVGQELYREMLMEYWDGRCAVTGLAVPELLRASHAKPWKNSDDRERLDVYNGLLLAVHLDALFDQGLVTVDPDGSLRRSPQLSTDALDLLVPDLGQLRVVRLTDMHQTYLSYHRAHVFKASDCLASPPETPQSIS